MLFLLVGLEVFTLKFDRLVDLVAGWRPSAWSSSDVGCRWPDPRPCSAWPAAGKVRPGLVIVLTWAGVRGGLSVAMALSLPPSRERGIILAATYTVVIFSIIVQGLTLEPVVVRLGYGRKRGRRNRPPPTILDRAAGIHAKPLARRFHARLPATRGVQPPGGPP